MPFQKPDYRQSSVNPGNHTIWFANFEHGAETTFNVVCHTLYAMPFYTGQGGLLQQTALRCRLAGGSNSANVRVALYNANFAHVGDLYPTTLLLDCGSFNMTATNTTVAVATSYVLPSSTFVWVAVIGDGTPQVEGCEADRASMFGCAMDDFGTTESLLRLTAASYAQAWPVTFPSSATALGGTNGSPIVGFQVTVF